MKWFRPNYTGEHPVFFCLDIQSHTTHMGITLGFDPNYSAAAAIPRECATWSKLDNTGPAQGLSLDQVRERYPETEFIRFVNFGIR